MNNCVWDFKSNKWVVIDSPARITAIEWVGKKTYFIHGTLKIRIPKVIGDLASWCYQKFK